MNQPVEYAQSPIALPSRVGQGTAVEQSRAVAEVQAAVIVAQQNPRNIEAARRSMRESCQQFALAERAFYSYPRSDGTVTGPSIHLARELARCWGNVQYGINELRRDDAYGESEMQAWAWDLETNTRSSQTFIVPHKRDTKKGIKDLTDLRGIYENNANNGARRVREAIFAVLPPMFVEEAKALCWQTLDRGPGKPLDARIAEAIAGFKARGISADQLESKIGYESDLWTSRDVARLGVIYKSIDRGETTADEEFPPKRITVDEVMQTTPAPSEESLGASEESPDSYEEPPAEPVDESLAGVWPESAPIPGAES